MRPRSSFGYRVKTNIDGSGQLPTRVRVENFGRTVPVFRSDAVRCGHLFLNLRRTQMRLTPSLVQQTVFGQANKNKNIQIRSESVAILSIVIVLSFTCGNIFELITGCTRLSEDISLYPQHRRCRVIDQFESIIDARSGQNCPRNQSIRSPVILVVSQLTEALAAIFAFKRFLLVPLIVFRRRDSRNLRRFLCFNLPRVWTDVRQG